MFKWLAAPAAAMIFCAPISAQNTANQRIEALIDSYTQSDQFQGNVRTSTLNEGVQELSRGFANVSTQQAHTAGSQFYIASITKAFTAVMALQMVEAETLDLDAPIAPFFPELDTEISERTTLRQLLNHTSGLPRDYTEALSGDGPFDMNDTIAAINSVGLQSEPGQLVSYSNTGYRLVAHMLESASGLGYEALLQNRIADLIGLEATSLTPRSDVSLGYESTDTITLSPVDLPSVGDRRLLGAGGLYSTSADLNTFIDALTEDRLLTTPMRELMLSATEAENSDGSDGMGVNFYPMGGGGRVIAMTGASDGYLSAMVWVEGSASQRVTVLGNDTRLGRGGFFPLLIGLLQQVLGAPQFEPAPATPVHTFLETLQTRGEAAALDYASGLDWSQAPIANAAASQATGAPNGGVGESMYAWAPATADAGEEWLYLQWNAPVEASSVHIQFTQIPNALTGIELDARHEDSIHQLADTGAPVIIFPLTELAPIEALTLRLDTAAAAGWPQIDAVGLVDAAGEIHWATHAQASTSAFRASGVAMHDLPTRDVLAKLVDRLTENGLTAEAARIRVIAPRIGH
jgi:D-alanyl-D-alanine carboxypeptidase